MDKAVISDVLTDQIGDCDVKAAVFTTFNFEPEFFELDVIPILLKQENAYSLDDRVKESIVRDSLRASQMLLEVFYDLPIFRQEGNQSPQMEYLYHGVNMGNKAFHAKSIFILLHDKEAEVDCLLVAAGSNNLSKAGWWDNIECQHWEEVWSGDVDRTFLNRLKQDVEWLSRRQGIVPSNHGSALNMISGFLEECKASNSSYPVSYYGPSHIERHGTFFNFLKQSRESLSNYSNWNLEIISPFFAEDTANKEHEAFRKHGVTDIKLLLPLDDEGNGCCDEKYYHHIKQSEGISWGKWSPRYIGSLGVGKDPFRRLHAKVYHFYNGIQAWAFVGSINFTHKALYENIESGFLVKLDHVEPMLELLHEDESVDKFNPPTSSGDESEVREELASCPELHISFDWIEKLLVGRTVEGKFYEINIQGPERESVIDSWTISEKSSIYKGDTAKLEDLLKNGSLVTVTGTSSQTGEVFPEHTLLLQQTGWTHKPISILNLSPNQILAIFAGMSQERRQLLLANAFIQKLIISGFGGEMTTILEEDIDTQFFCEYAEIFHAFRKLRDQLHDSLENKLDSQVDYYLTGSGMDSLPTLLNCVEEKAENEVTGVTAYLLLLSAKEIYRDPNFISRPNVKTSLKEVEDKIVEIKGSERIKLEETKKNRREEFFRWYEEQFTKEYVQQKIEDDVN